MTALQLSLLRSAAMSGAGFVLLLYAIFALLSGRPDPMPIWITFASGVLAWLAIAGGAVMAGRKNREQAFDEGYDAGALLAQRIGFWTAIWLYPVFTGLMWAGIADWAVSFAAMGCLTAASYLISAGWLDIRGQR